MTEHADVDRHHSRLLRLDRRGSAAPFQNAIEALVEQLESLETGRKRRRKAPDLERLTETMETMVADLYLARADDPELWLGYSRNQNDYISIPRYRSGRATHTTVVIVADFLLAQGYAEHVPGYYRRASDSNEAWTQGGMRSRLRATQRLEALLWEDHGALPDHITTIRNAELIRLKNSAKEYIDYSETAETSQMRKELETINALISKTPIAAPRALEGVNPDQTSMTLYRVFNDGRFDRGGRFYGGWWINAKKDHRSQITINGQPTVELDFSAHHLRLCYHLSGLQPPDQDDLYALEGTEGLRKAVKWAVTVLLNLGPGKRMPRPDDKLKDLLRGRMTTAQLRRVVETRYAEIGDWFGAGRGTELQWIDGRIGSTVLNTLALNGVACLPVHDSFIVEEQHRTLLSQTMIEAYSKQVYEQAGHTFLPSVRD